MFWSIFLISYAPLALKTTLLKRESNKGVFQRVLQNFKSIYFEEHLRTAAF